MTSNDPHGQFVLGEGRIHINNDLMRESLVATRLTEQWQGRGQGEEVKLLPWASQINLGGSSIIDRGGAVLLPLLEEIVELRKKSHFILSVGGGARLRHTMKIALDLGLPTGGMAQVVGAAEEQNSHIVHALLSQYGGVSMCREHFPELAKYLLTGMTPITISVPPYHLWEPPSKRGVLPENGSDMGAFMSAEVLGLKKMIFLKDQDGQFDKNPRLHKGAKLLSTVTAEELMTYDPDNLILEQSTIDCLLRARNVREIHVINGLVPGNLTKCLNGEAVGTVITQA